MKLHIPKKRFGQHFLTDETVVSQILQSIALQPQDNVVEIGPGLGALTYPLLNQLKHLNGVEIDNALALAWQEKQLPTLTLLHQDALQVDYHQFGQSLRVVGNLPYNIATALLLYLLDFLETIQDMHVMVQKEVACRITALPHIKAYGRLSVMLQAFCEVAYLFEVPPNAFSNPPKVQSALIRLIPRDKHFRDNIKKDRLEQLLSKAFAMRRKTLLNNLKGGVTHETLLACGINNPNLRAEEVSVAQYIQLADYCPAPK